MKHTRTFYMLIFILVWLGKASAQDNMIINFTNSSLKGIAISSIDKVTFADGAMIVAKTDLTSESVLLNDVNKITFGVYSAVKTVDAGAFSFYPNPATNFIILQNPELIKSEISIISLDGRVLLTHKVSSEKEIINISALAKGIYLLKVYDNTLKLIKR